VIDNHTIASLESAAAWTSFNDQSRGLMAGNDPLIAFRSLPQVLMVNTSDIGTAYRRCFYLEQYLAVAWFWYRYTFEFNGTVPWKERRLHGCLHFWFYPFCSCYFAVQNKAASY
jgi:hypothetical protein